jgi:hypothetical protein
MGRRVTRRAWIGAGAGLLIVGLAALPMNFGGESARNRARQYFDVRGPVDTASLRSAVLRTLPPSTPEVRIDEFVRNQRIGSERGTAYYETPGGRGIRIDDRPGPIQLVTATYFIDVDLDYDRQLRDVRVRQVFTGP